MDTTTLQALIQGANTMSEAAEARRLETLGIAAELGADEAVLRPMQPPATGGRGLSSAPENVRSESGSSGGSPIMRC